MVLGAVHHGAELDDPEPPTALPYTRLREEHRAGRLQPHQRGHDGEHRAEDDQTCNGAREIKHALEDELPPLETGRRQLHDRLLTPPHQIRLHARDLDRPRPDSTWHSAASAAST